MPRRGPLEPGDRDRIITIQQRTATEDLDDHGGPMDAEWSTLVEHMPASKEDIGGQERMQAQQLSAKYDTRFEINYREDMDPELVDVPTLRRIQYLGRVHDIVSASEIGRREGIELLTLASTRVS